MIPVLALTSAGFEEWTTRRRLRIEEADLDVNDIFEEERGTFLSRPGERKRSPPGREQI
jgi:hypothetical protein